MSVIPAPQGANPQAMSTERAQGFLDMKLLSAMKAVAEIWMQSGALPNTIKNAPQLIMVLQAGYEAGLQPLEAIRSFYFVNGNLALYGEMAITMVMRAGHKIEWGKCDATTATVTITRKDGTNSMTNTFTMKDAQERKLDMGRDGRKDPWVKFPENMLKFKVFHMTAKFVCPDAFHGVNDIGELTEEREPVKAEIIDTAKKAELPAGNGQSLEDRLASKRVEEEKKPKAKKKAEDVPTETEAPVEAPKEEKPAEAIPEAPKTETKESEEEYIQRLVNEEIEGRKLTPREVMEVNAFKARSKTV